MHAAQTNGGSLLFYSVHRRLELFLWERDGRKVPLLCLHVQIIDTAVSKKRDVLSAAAAGVDGAVVPDNGSNPDRTAGVALSPADRLARACYEGDLPSAAAAIADGASVNGVGIDQFGNKWLPLAAAVHREWRDVVVWLLSRGADPNGDAVMACGAIIKDASILQLLVDAGCDVNRHSGEQLPLFAAVEGYFFLENKDSVRVLLAQPSLALTVTFRRSGPVEFAREWGKHALAEMIAQGKPFCFWFHSYLYLQLTSLCGCWGQVARRAVLVRSIVMYAIAPLL